MRNLRSILATALLFLLCNSCTTVPNIELCSIAGVISAGAICVNSNNDSSRDMTMDEFFDFLEPVEAYTDESGVYHAARDGAKCMSTEDYTETKIAMEQMCRLLGKRCTYEMRKALRKLP